MTKAASNRWELSLRLCMLQITLKLIENTTTLCTWRASSVGTVF